MFCSCVRHAGISRYRSLHADGPEVVGSASAFRRPAGHDQRSTGIITNVYESLSYILWKSVAIFRSWGRVVMRRLCF